MKYSCVIVDDEQDAVDLLAARLKVICKDVDLVKCCYTWQEALNALRSIIPDIIFMDISMPGKNGMDILKLIPELRSEVIFITAHEEFALQAFEFATSGYILKPVDDVDLLRSVERATRRLSAYKKEIASDNHRIGIPDSKGITYVDIQNIEYLESINGYTKVITNNGTIVSSFNLGKFSSVIHGQHFFRVHRSYIVNINSVTRYKSTGELLMRDGKEIPVSKNVRDEFLSLFDVLTKNNNESHQK